MRGLILAAGLMLASCGVQAQTTPEPNETKRIGELVRQLGTQRSYNRKTLVANADPDGLVLLRWIARRRATLDHTLSLNQLPALTNPGSVKSTLAWELKTENLESKERNSMNHYLLDYRMRELTCPKVASVEKEWFDKESQAHAQGMRNSILDWLAVSARYQAQCDLEKKQTAEQHQLEKDRIAARNAQFAAEEKACHNEYDAAYERHLKEFTPATGAQVTAATTRMNDCIANLTPRTD